MKDALDKDTISKIWHKAGEERLSGHFKTGWHWPDDKEKVFYFANFIKCELLEDRYADYFTIPEVEAFVKKAKTSAWEYGLHDSKEYMLRDPLFLISLVEVVTKHVHDSNSKVELEPFQV